MRRWLRLVGYVSAAWTAARWVLNEVGYVETAYKLVAQMPQVLEWAGRVALWPLTGPLLALACVIALFLIGRQERARIRADADAGAGRVAPVAQPKSTLAIVERTIELFRLREQPRRRRRKK